MTRSSFGRAYLPVHGDPVLRQLEDYDLVCYFVYTLSSWWEMPLIDRINARRADNNFAIIMDVNPAPETMYRLVSWEQAAPPERYKAGLQEIFPEIVPDAAAAMYNLLRNGFGHNLFGREPGKIHFDNNFVCPPVLDDNQILLVPPVQLALSMVTAFMWKIKSLLLYPADERMSIFRYYMIGSRQTQ